MEKPIYPLELTKSSDELKKLIAENPDLPIVVLAEYDLPTDYSWTYAASISFRISEILDCYAPFNDETVCTDRDDFEERLADWLCDRDDIFDDSGKCPANMTDEEFDVFLKEEKERYAPYWTKVIAIYAGK